VKRAPWQVFPLLLPSAAVAKDFIENAAAESLQIRRGYNPSLEDWPRTRKMGASPNARSLAERMVLLPVYSDGTEDEIMQILAIVRKTLRDALTV
jgi:dTDP-4-amino-4,6-dideoxygalactose transaminase